MTAIDVLALGAAVMMVVVYTQCWLMAVQGDKAAADSGLVRALFFPAYAGGLFLVALSPAEVLRTWLRQPLLILILWIVAASALWSINPDQTLRRVIALVLTTLGGITLASRWSWARMAEIIAAAHGLLAILSLALCVAAPAYGTMHELFPGAWRGLWVEKNLLGGNMTVGFIACVAAALLEPRRARLWAALAGLCLVLVLGSTSKTSLVACLLGACGVALVAIIRRGRLGRLVGVYGAVTAVLVLGVGLLAASDIFLAALGKDATLTGRTLIWDAVMRRIQERPWLGYGYAAVWSDTDPWAPLAWITRQAGFRAFHAHNSWLEQWLGLGIVGLAAWSLYFLEAWTRTIIALFRSAGAYLALPFLLVFTMTTFTESVAVIFNDSRWMILVAIVAKLAQGEDRAQMRN
jgi:exopolysaccharide production protein ExoQ